MATQVRLAVIGAGLIGRKHVETIAEEAGAQLVAIADQDATVDALAASHGVPRYDDYRAMLAGEKLDGVIIATPTDSHATIALEALDAGAHLLIEKPIAATVAEGEKIAGQARASNRHVLVGHHRRYHGAVDAARQIVQDGDIGSLVAVNGQWTTLKPDSHFDPEWRRKIPGGPVMTNLIHEIDTLRTICGDIVSVSAETSGAIRGHEAEDTAAVVLRFASGALGTFLLSDAAPSPWTWEFATGENPLYPRHHQNVCRFMGTEAALEFPNLRVWRYRDGERGWNFSTHREDIDTPERDVFAAQCAHFCAVIRGDEIPCITAEDANGSLAATVAVFEAMATGCRVTLR
jgi:predicted dehydrogenase